MRAGRPRRVAWPGLARLAAASEAARRAPAAVRSNGGELEETVDLAVLDGAGSLRRPGRRRLTACAPSPRSASASRSTAPPTARRCSPPCATRRMVSIADVSISEKRRSLPVFVSDRRLAAPPRPRAAAPRREPRRAGGVAWSSCGSLRCQRERSVRLPCLSPSGGEPGDAGNGHQQWDCDQVAVI